MRQRSPLQASAFGSSVTSISLSWPVKQRLAITFSTALLVACGSTPHAPAPVQEARPVTGKPATAPVLPKANSGKGAYYKDDGPGDNPPEGLEFTVDPIPVVESFSRSANKPYVVFGKTYTPIADSTTPFIQRGVGSWYGKKFHGQRTSSGEPYDMYKITAAHPTLPIPSYARVTNLGNGKQIIVRINDRGPFHSSRIIDLSYTAALKLQILGKGSSQIEVERLLPADIERMAENRKNQPVPVSQPTSVLVNNTVPLRVPEVAAVVSTSPVPAPASVSMEALNTAQDVRPVEKLSTVATTPATNGFYLQFGAYAIRANAENIMGHLKGKADNRLPGFDIVQQGSLYRLLSGPFNSRAEAQQVLAQVGDLGVGRPIVIQR
ncbi:septal ring lytic transglycosylase RlpA family protein [Undibacterium sp. CY7W]|uniref:Endolytic peptidoglycan transglycosylase RlpA n=1 Tax=Undibacterium rugosum TaxID=2762291 RepID=A0A923KRU3_9BURK|nr:septal ring lytic transglycosylase RlpA family protein [Undibacterium rugosum]MBC3934204.1 septal ring lytic transglycosylase RlpA family protein [Undibacterium rugosum]